MDSSNISWACGLSNMYVACTLMVTGLAWFAVVQRRGRRMAAAGLPAPELAAGGAGPERAITETPAARHDRVLRRGSDQVPGDFRAKITTPATFQLSVRYSRTKPRRSRALRLSICTGPLTPASSQRAG